MPPPPPSRFPTTAPYLTPEDTLKRRVPEKEGSQVAGTGATIVLYCADDDENTYTVLVELLDGRN